MGSNITQLTAPDLLAGSLRASKSVMNRPRSRSWLPPSDMVLPANDMWKVPACLSRTMIVRVCFHISKLRLVASTCCTRYAASLLLHSVLADCCSAQMLGLSGPSSVDGGKNVATSPSMEPAKHDPRCPQDRKRGILDVQ